MSAHHDTRRNTGDGLTSTDVRSGYLQMSPDKNLKYGNKKITFINSTLNDYMNSDIKTPHGSSKNADAVTSASAATVSNNPGGFVMLHKHSKLLNF